MTDYTYELYTQAIRRMAKLVLAVKNDDGRYTEEMMATRNKLMRYQAYENKHCTMWRPWEIHVQHIIDEVRGEGWLFTDNETSFTLMELEEDVNTDNEEEINAIIATRSPPPAPIKIKRAA
jgi:hypothetical protein